MVYTMDLNKFIDTYNALNNQGLNVTSYTDTAITGTINVHEAGTLMFSIPYDPSWTLKVNGVKTEITEIAEALIGVELAPGDYTIELSFTPRGFKPGMLISISALLILFIVYCFYRREAGKGFLPFTKPQAAAVADNSDTTGVTGDNDNSDTAANANAASGAVDDNAGKAVDAENDGDKPEAAGDGTASGDTEDSDITNIQH